MTEAIQRGLLIDRPWEGPRPRPLIGPNQKVALRYSDQEFLRRPWLDAKGRVVVTTNRFAMRDRQDLQEQKPAGETRVLCLGDSITMAWGVPEELGWARQLETNLRSRHPALRVLNAGGVGTICVDEYHAALKNRWHSFEPDAVVVATGVNDLMPSNGLAVFPPEEARQVGAMVNTGALRGPLDLDPNIDWAARMRSLDQATCEARGLTGFDRPWDAMWDRGVPQAALLAMRDWCRARDVAFVVALWPLLQGLGARAHVRVPLAARRGRRLLHGERHPVGRPAADPARHPAGGTLGHAGRHAPQPEGARARCARRSARDSSRCCVVSPTGRPRARSRVCTSRAATATTAPRP